jgi:hypothetical protein
MAEFPRAALLDDFITSGTKPPGFKLRTITPAILELVSSPPLSQTVIRLDLRHRLFCMLGSSNYLSSVAAPARLFGRHTAFTKGVEPHAISFALTLEPTFVPDAHFLNVDYNLQILCAHALHMTRTMSGRRMDHAYNVFKSLCDAPHTYCNLFNLEPDPAWPARSAEPPAWLTYFQLDGNFTRAIGRKLVEHRPNV